ncbi:hypothetical protein LguiB_006534 [Lonicera macranthoides]
MAPTRVCLFLVVVIGSFYLIRTGMGSSFPPLLLRTFSTLKSCNFDQIYQLGDSISDTGNLILEPGGAATPFGSLPYGESFFRNATGRCSDGMLMIDYIAIASGLPLLNPYKKVDADFRHGVNFAVAGATALPVDVLANWNTRTSATNSSLNIQLDWMSTYFNSLCHPDCAEKHRSSLFVVGEIGGNDINYALLQGKPIEEVRNMVPVIVRAIKDAVLRVIHNGAIRIVVPGNFPIGCLPASLTLFQTNNSSAYDQHNCLNELNNLSIYQNELLQLAIKELKQQNPNTMILYGDYYNAFQWLYHNAQYFGFDMESLQKGCCGTGGDYNFDLAKFCGSPGVPVCNDPSQRLSWDGVHFTQAAYKVMASWLINDILPQLQCFQSSVY